jgi:hypothetical protein
MARLPGNVAAPDIHHKDQTMRTRDLIVLLALGSFAIAGNPAAAAEKMESIAVSADGMHFVEKTSGRKFVPWGFNYDRDSKMRLLEDYWEAEWPTVEEDFREMKRLGANVVRIHLQLGRFMEAQDRANEKSLAQLSRLLELAEQTGLRLDLTGLGCYHRKDVPAWYDKLTEADRWKVQARFWEAVAARGAKSPAVFCYDLMNEPVAPGELQKSGDWLVGPPFGGKQYVQFIALDPQKRPRAKIAQAWVRTLVEAIRKQDRGHLVTVGLLPGTPDRADAWSGFDPKELGDLDYLSVHIYPKKGEVDAALKILAEARRRLDRLLLGPDARGTPTVEGTRRPFRPRVAGVLREEGAGVEPPLIEQRRWFCARSVGPPLPAWFLTLRPVAFHTATTR